MRLSTLIALLSFCIVGVLSVVFLYLGYYNIEKNIDAFAKDQLSSTISTSINMIKIDSSKDIDRFLTEASKEIEKNREYDYDRLTIDTNLSGTSLVDFAYFNPINSKDMIKLENKIVNCKKLPEALLLLRPPRDAELYQVEGELDKISFLAASIVVIDPETKQKKGVLYAGVILNSNTKLLKKLSQNSELEAIALLQGSEVIAISPNSFDKSLITSIKNRLNGQEFFRHKEYVFMKKPISDTNSTQQTYMMVVSKSNILEQLKDDAFKTIIAVVAVMTILFFILYYILGELFIKPFNKLYTMASKGEDAEEFDRSHIKELNDIGYSITKLILSLKESNKLLKKRIEEEVAKLKAQEEIIHEQSRHNALNELLINIAHQWRQPLNVIALRGMSIIEKVENEDTSKEAVKKSVIESAEKICKHTQDISKLITEFTRFYESDDSSGSFLVSDAIKQALKMVSFGKISIKIDIPQDIQHKSGKKALVESVVAILNNSIEIANARNITEPKINISLKESDEHIELSIDDNCGGIDGDILPKIFYPYTTTFFKSKNKGLGLYLASNLVKYRLGGEISVQNEPSGAKFTLRIKKHG